MIQQINKIIWSFATFIFSSEDVGRPDFHLTYKLWHTELNNNTSQAHIQTNNNTPQDHMALKMWADQTLT